MGRERSPAARMARYASGNCRPDSLVRTHLNGNPSNAAKAEERVFPEVGGNRFRPNQEKVLGRLDKLGKVYYEETNLGPTGGLNRDRESATGMTIGRSGGAWKSQGDRAPRPRDGRA